MTFVPIVPMSGLQGWTFLSVTLDAQRDAFAESGEVGRETEAFEKRISGIMTAEGLVSDRRLLSVALTAFGLEGDIDNIYLIRKVLEDGTLSPDALANRFSDKRYLNFSKAFGFGDFEMPRTQLSDFPDEILAAYRARKFEAAIGDQDQDLRLALSFDREVMAIAETERSDTAKWLAVLGNPPLKSIIEKSLFLPKSFGKIPLDQQVEIMREKVDSRFGVSDFNNFQDPKIRDMLRINFLLASGIAQNRGGIGSSVALSLLQGRAALRV